MRGLLKRDISIKVVSVLFAVLLWLYVYNVSNPLKEDKFTVALRVINAEALRDKGIVTKNYETSIQVYVKGRDEIVKSLSSNDFDAVLDFSKIESADERKITIDKPTFKVKDKMTDVTIVDWPKSVAIDLERIESKSFPITLDKKIQLKDNYKIVNIMQDSETIALDEVESLVKTVASVKATLEANGLDKNLETKLECKFYDKAGKVINALNKKHYVVVKVEVAKEVPITLVVKGKPAQDFVEGLRTIAPEKALITGPYEIVSKITELKTEPVDIGNANQPINVQGLLKLPEGVKLVNTPKEITVSIPIEPLVTKEYTFSRDEIEFINAVSDGTLVYEIKDENVTFQVKGKQEDLQNLSILGMKPTVNVDGVAEGTHNLTVNISLPISVKLIQERSVEVKISKMQQEPQ